MITISISEATPPITAAARSVRRVEVANLDHVLDFATQASIGKAARGLCPGLPISNTPVGKHKINRSRDNLRDAQILAIDLDGVPTDAWDRLVEHFAGWSWCWADSWSHARKAKSSPGLVWRHVILELERPASAGEYAAAWTALAAGLVPIGVEPDASKRNIEDVIYLGTEHGDGARGSIEGRPWPVVEAPEPAPKPKPVKKLAPPRLRAVSGARIESYAAATPDPVGEPEFCAALVKLKTAASTEAEFRDHALALANRSVSLAGNPMLDSEHYDSTLDKIDSVARNDAVVLGSLEDRPPDPSSWLAKRLPAPESLAAVPSPVMVTPSPSVAAPVQEQQRELGVDVTEMDLAQLELVRRLGRDPSIYRRDLQLVRVEPNGTITELVDSRGTLSLREHCLRTFGYYAINAEGVMYTPKGGQGELIDVVSRCPLLREHVRPLTRVTLDPVPVRTAHGIEITSPGYYRDPIDPERGTLHLPGGLSISSAEPSRKRAEEGYALLCRLIADWPLIDGACRASVLALILTAICRPVIEGPAPLFVVSSNMRGSGKGLLLRTVSILATGHATAETVIAKSREEQGKQVVAAFRSGRPLIVLDEVQRLAAIHELDSIVTAYPRYASRTLGKSEVVEFDATPIWCAAGNNVSVEADSVRRVLAIRLETEYARPEEREDFAISDVLAHVVEHRAKYYQAAIDVLRYGFTLGEGDVYVRAMGSFERWSKVIRRPLCALGPDPLDSRASLGIDVVEHDRASLLIELLRESGPTRIDGLAQYVGRLASVGIDATKLSYALRRERGVIVDGWTIQHVTEGGRRLWQAVEVGSPAASPRPRLVVPEPVAEAQSVPSLADLIASEGEDAVREKLREMTRSLRATRLIEPESWANDRDHLADMEASEGAEPWDRDRLAEIMAVRPIGAVRMTWAVDPAAALPKAEPEPEPKAEPEPSCGRCGGTGTIFEYGGPFSCDCHESKAEPEPWGQRGWGDLPDPILVARSGPGSLAIVDGTGSICRGYYAAPEQPNHGLAELAREVRALRWAGVERVVVCLDARVRSRDHRRELAADYKANRPSKPEGLIGQLTQAPLLLRALGVHAASCGDAEADDLIAHYALAGLAAGLPWITILTIDKDLEQLITPEGAPSSVRILTPKGQLVGPAEVFERRGVPVQHLDSFLALVGDSSDGIRGVQGVGPKIAARLICEHGDLEGVLAAAPMISGAVGVRLLRDAEQARLARQLVWLRPDLVVGDHFGLPSASREVSAVVDGEWLRSRGIV
jgi:5'-3' exonuclease